MMKQLSIAVKWILLGLGMSVGTTPATAQQAMQFTQYMFHGILVNPGYTGTDDALKISLVNRMQWVSVEGAPVTQGLFLHSPVANKRVGVGLSFTNDRIGVHRSQVVKALAAYHLPVSTEGTLSFGMQVGANMSRSNYASLNTGTGGIDPQLAALGDARTAMVLGMGVYYHSGNFDVGFSVPNVISQSMQIEDSGVARWSAANYLLLAQYRFRLNDALNLQPGLLLKYYPGSPVSFDVNTCLIIRDVLTLGVAYRRAESIDLLMRAKLTQQLQFGYSYDHIIGQVAGISRGTHELSISYLFSFSHDNVVSPR